MEIDSDALESRLLQACHLVQPEEVAELTYFLCNPKMRHLTGTEINLDGGKKPTI